MEWIPGLDSKEMDGRDGVMINGYIDVPATKRHD